MSFPRPLTRHTNEREQLARFLAEGRHRLGNARCMTYRQIAKALGIPLGSVFEWVRDLHPEVSAEIKHAPLIAKILAQASQGS